MDNRELVLKLLQDYKSFDESEEGSRVDAIKFVKQNAGCFDNDFKLGHITGSALVVDKELTSVLLTHHSALDKWFQFGGHSDSWPNPIETGFREATEESGLKVLKFIPGHEDIFDIDIHPIPEKKEMPLHNHYDIRIILIADKNERFLVSNESKDLKWILLEDAEKYNSQPAFLRMIKKVKFLAMSR